MEDFDCFEAHASHVNDVRFSPDGEFLVSAGMDNLIKLWSVEDDWSEHKAVEAHEKSVNAFAFGHDGKTITTVSSDRTVRLWSFPDFEPLRTLTGHKNKISAVQISPNGRLIATAGADTTVRIWEWETGECVHTLKGHRREVDSLCFIDDSTLVSAGLGDDVVLWSVSDGAKVGKLEGHKATVTLAGLTPDDAHLITAGYEGQVKIWSVGDWRPRRSFQPGPAGMLRLAISAHGRMLTIGSERNIAIWSLDMLEHLVDLPIKPKGVHGVAFSPDSQWLACAASDKRIRIWDVDDVI